VYNERTYPLLTRLFAELGVATQPSQMSMSVRCAGCGLQYAGQRGLPGLAVGLPRGRGGYLRMLAEVARFHRAARRLPVTGGSRRYVELAAKQPPGLRLSRPVRAVRRFPAHAEVRDAAGEAHRFDAVVIAALTPRCELRSAAAGTAGPATRR
jgi:predicted NAD/FAD-binding protein